MVLRDDFFDFKYVGSVRLSPYYEKRLYQYLEGNIYNIFHQNILKSLNGIVTVTEGKAQTVVVKLEFTVHCNLQSVGMVISEEEFSNIPTKEIATYLTESFLFYFGNLALSAFLNPLSKEEKRVNG